MKPVRTYYRNRTPSLFQLGRVDRRRALAFGLAALAAACGSGGRTPESSNDLAAAVELENTASERDYPGDASMDANSTPGTGNAAGPVEGTATETALGNTVSAEPGDFPAAVAVPAPASPPVAIELNPTKPGPLVAPNGYRWPSAAGYLQGYDVLRGGGLSSVTVDNSANDTNVWVKLVAVDTNGPTPVRQIFIPAYGSFTMAGVAVGTYDVRYMNLADGSLVGTEPFSVSQTQAADGTIQYRDWRMTLYKVSNGNMRTHALSLGEF